MKARELVGLSGERGGRSVSMRVGREGSIAETTLDVVVSAASNLERSLGVVVEEEVEEGVEEEVEEG